MFEALANLHFLRPGWLLAVIPAVLIAWYWAKRKRADSHWESSIAPELLRVLLEPGSRRRSRRLPWLLALAMTAAAAGLAGPAWERLPQPVERKTDALVILLDLSLSMFAEDVAPSRLVRARQKVADVLRRRDEGFTALVAYAGDAHAVVPLTDDVRTIENLLTALRPDIMPVLGSNLSRALEEAHALFDNARVAQGRILVVTDGIDDLAEASSFRHPRFPISVLGIGTEAGARIPLAFVNQPGQVLRSQEGEPIIARLEPERLASLADASFGRYHTLTLADQDLEHLLATPLPGDDETQEVERDFDTWADMGFWAAVLLIPLVLSGFRRGVLVLVPVLLLPAPADAGVWDDLWQRRDQQAHRALREGEPETAAILFQQDDWRAAALYRSGEYAGAAESYRARGSTTALYNLGNALAHQQEYDAAIEAYQQVLEREPDHEDARFNKELLEKLQREQSSEQDQEGNDQPGSDQPQDQAQPQDGEGDPGEDDSGEQGYPPEDTPPSEGREQPSRPLHGEDAEQDQLASRDERQDALEQWLRRVPDDPGGLLRRKFQYETNQRLRRGDYRSRETEKIW